MAEFPNELIPTRASLIQRLKNWRDQASWEEFFETYWRLIYGVATKGGLTDAEAQDVVQETLVAVARHIPDFKYDPVIGSFKAWLLNMTRWRIADQIRKRLPVEAGLEPDSHEHSDHIENSYQIGHSDNPNTSAKPDKSYQTYQSDQAYLAEQSDHLGSAIEVPPDLEKIWEVEWEKNLLEVAIHKARRNLDPTQYQIFDFYANKGWTPERVAKTFGVSVNQVYSAKHYVTEKIAQEVERLKRETI
jgi:RNA polymerase sigma-70 factor (ECF subfamily)